MHQQGFIIILSIIPEKIIRVTFWKSGAAEIIRVKIGANHQMTEFGKIFYKYYWCGSTDLNPLKTV